MTYSIYDLEVRTDAVTFAVLLTIGGAMFWVVGRRLFRGRRPLRDARLVLVGAALIASGAFGVAFRSTVGGGDAVPVAATIAAAPVDGRAGSRPSLRPDEPRFAPDAGSSSRSGGSTRTGDTADPESATGRPGTGSPADDPGSGSGSDTAAGPPQVGVAGPDEPPDDPPPQQPDDPPSEDPTDAPDTDTDGDADDDTDGEGSGQGPDGQGPPGQGEGGPPGQGPDGQGPPGHGSG